jgi:hypothetical protein
MRTWIVNFALKKDNKIWYLIAYVINICMEENNIENKTAETKDSVTTTSESSVARAIHSESPMTTKIIAIIVGIGLIGLGAWYFMSTQAGDDAALSSETDSGTGSISAQEYPAVVAVVDGVEISNVEFENSYAQILQTASQQGVAVTDPATLAQAETNALDTLVNTMLLKKATQEAGYVASDEAVAAEMTALEVQYESPEAFLAIMAENGLTIEEVQTDVRNRLGIDAYLTASIDMSLLVASAEEVQALYDSFVAGSEELPPLDDVYAEVEAQIVAQKQQEAISVVIDGLRENATIEVLI